MTREHFLPSWFESAINLVLSNWKLSLSDSKRIAEAVLKMSDYYIAHPTETTPWKESWCQVAQAAYFLPLNFLRSEAVAKEARARGFPISTEILDFGSGLGAGSLPWQQGFNSKLTCAERSSEARKLHEQILRNSPFAAQVDRIQWISEKDIRPVKSRTALFSYSLTEVTDLPKWILECESLIWIEPSTRDDGRRLLMRRKELLTQGFSMWAPCPHQLGCPLLEDSKTDWCHDRIAARLPKWFLEIEKHLPMRNQTLTFTYLLAAKKSAPPLQQWRTVGDQLVEKGKTRQLVCRGPEREFLAWLHRDGPAPEIPRGVLIDPPPRFEKKANELRRISE